MQPIIYDVAVSADGFIAGPGGDVSAFPHSGPIVDDYLTRLGAYGTVLMGRATYEFGYRYGLKPGANPYPHARTCVISTTLDLPANTQVTVQRGVNADVLTTLRTAADRPIYLCGGGALAATLAELGQIQILRLKRAPVILGGGTPLFAPLRQRPALHLTSQTDHGNGLIYQEFQVTF